MALWHYTFYILPKKGIEIKQIKIESLKRNSGDFQDHLFWEAIPTDKSFFNEIRKVLAKGKSWSNYIDLYGEEESNCLEVLYDDNNVVESVSFRVDFRGEYIQIVNDLIAFCISKGLLIIDEDLNLVPPDSEALKKCIDLSSQIKVYNRLL